MTVSDDEIARHIEAISDLPLEQRPEALAQASEALRVLLDGTEP